MGALEWGLLLTAVTGLIWGAVGILYSMAAAGKGSFSAFMLLSSLGFIAFSWCFMLPQRAPGNEIAYVALIMIPSGLAGQFGFFAMLKAMKLGYHSLAWGIGQAAMVCPFTAGVLWLGEAASVGQLAGVGAMLAALPLLALANGAGAGGKGALKPFVGWIAIAFGLIGLQQILSLLPGHGGIGEAALSWRVPLLSLAGLVWVVPAVRNWRGQSWRPAWKLAFAYAVVVAAGQGCVFAAIDRLSGVQMSKAVYPLALGICIAAVFLYCRVVRKERTSWLGYAGLVLVIGGMVLLALQ